MDTFLGIAVSCDTLIRKDFPFQNRFICFPYSSIVFLLPFFPWIFQLISVQHSRQSSSSYPIFRLPQKAEHRLTLAHHQNIYSISLLPSFRLKNPRNPSKKDVWLGKPTSREKVRLGAKDTKRAWKIVFPHGQEMRAYTDLNLSLLPSSRFVWLLFPFSSHPIESLLFSQTLPRGWNNSSAEKVSFLNVRGKRKIEKFVQNVGGKRKDVGNGLMDWKWNVWTIFVSL